MEDFLKIEIAGEEAEHVYCDLVLLEVEIDEELASMFRMQLTLNRDGGDWTYLDDAEIRPWQEISISAGLADDNDLLLSGYITQIKPIFGSDLQSAVIEIMGMDKSVAMDRMEILKDWPDKSDSDIAEAIFAKYGLEPDVEATDVVHSEETSTIIQRDTDIQFLRRLALRNGYECYVQGDTGVFKSLDLDSPSQGVLAVHFGEETNTYGFTLELDALMPTGVAMQQIDRLNKTTSSVAIETSDIKVLGAQEAASLLGEKTIPEDGTPIGKGLRYIGQNSAFGEAEMEALSQGLFQKSEWLIRASGEVNSAEYGKVVQARKLITVKGIGETYSGEFYVCRVKHLFTLGGYTQYVTLKRNAIELTGDEQFSEDAGLALPF